MDTSVQCLPERIFVHYQFQKEHIGGIHNSPLAEIKLGIAGISTFQKELAALLSQFS